MTTDNCPMTDAAADARTLRVDVCPECGSKQKEWRRSHMVTNTICDDKWHDQPAPNEPISVVTNLGEARDIQDIEERKPPRMMKQSVSATPRTDAMEREIEAATKASATADTSPAERMANCFNLAIAWAGKLERELAEAKRELERERIRLAACGVVAMSDTPESAKASREMHQDYYSASCDDVARRVDECMKLRDELAKAEARAAELQLKLDNQIAMSRIDCQVMAAAQEKVAELQAKLDAETKRANELLAALKGRDEADETRRLNRIASGEQDACTIAHNAAIDKCVPAPPVTLAVPAPYFDTGRAQGAAMKKPSEGIMTKTLGQVLAEVLGEDWDKCSAKDRAKYERIAASVVAHARPQIEAEARAAIVEQIVAYSIAWNDEHWPKPRPPETDEEIAKGIAAIRALAALPPTHVCVPVEFVQKMQKIAKYPESRADEFSAAGLREIARNALGMLAASKGDA